MRRQAVDDGAAYVNFASEKGGYTALHIAAANGNKEAAEFLLDSGAEVGQTQREGRTALHIAAVNNQTEMVKLLLGRGADKGATDEDGKVAVELMEADNPDISAMLG